MVARPLIFAAVDTVSAIACQLTFPGIGSPCLIGSKGTQGGRTFVEMFPLAFHKESRRRYVSNVSLWGSNNVSR